MHNGTLAACIKTESVSTKTTQKRFKWLSESAAQGHSIAQRDLALMYRDGTGIQRDLIKAYMWFCYSSVKCGI